MSLRDWVERASQLERELGREIDWDFDRTSSQPQVSTVRQLSAEELAVRDIFRLAALLALFWHVPPQLVLFALAGDAPDEAEWAKLVSRSWDGLPASARATLNGLASEEAA